MGPSSAQKEESVRRSVSRSLNLLTKADRIKVFLFIGAQLLVSILDSLGVLLMGAVASLGLSLTSSTPTASPLQTILSRVGIHGVRPATLLPICGVAVVVLLLIRTTLSLMISLKTYVYLAEKGSEISAVYIKRLFLAPFWWVRIQSVNDLSFALTQGVQYSVIGVLGQFIILVSEICFLTLIFAVLLWVNFLMAIVASAFFLVFGAFVYLRVGRHISGLAERTTQRVVEGNQQVQNSLNLFREIFVLSRAEKFERDFEESRLASGMLFARLNWLQLVPKFSVEIAVVLGAFFLALSSTLTSGYVNAISDLVVFLAATSRLAPSALRLQQSLISVRAFAGQSLKSFQYFEELADMHRRATSSIEAGIRPIPTQASSSIPIVKFEEVSYQFRDGQTPVIDDVTFQIAPGEAIALVGPSGSGKSTLCDLLLGLLTPSTGRVSIDGYPAHEFITEWPGRVAYLPQETLIIPGTLGENVTIGIPDREVEERELLSALGRAQLLEFVKALPKGVDQAVGDTGLKLSGGQRQRVGLARALYEGPSLLILDEPTSALDAETEDALMQTLRVMKGQCSILIIAHRLSTLKFVDRVMYLQDGRLKAIGAVDEVRALVPRFDLQAGLQGL